MDSNTIKIDFKKKILDVGSSVLKYKVFMRDVYCHLLHDKFTTKNHLDNYGPMYEKPVQGCNSEYLLNKGWAISKALACFIYDYKTLQDNIGVNKYTGILSWLGDLYEKVTIPDFYEALEEIFKGASYAGFDCPVTLQTTTHASDEMPMLVDKSTIYTLIPGWKVDKGLSNVLGGMFSKAKPTCSFYHPGQSPLCGIPGTNLIGIDVGAPGSDVSLVYKVSKKAGSNKLQYMINVLGGKNG